MTSGGARNRSGPAPDPTSARSDKRGVTAGLTMLPAEGYTEKAPRFPLPPIPDAVPSLRRREMGIWRELWKTPQACAWAVEPWRWQTVAELCRLKAVVERDPGSNASLISQMHRFRDQVGLTPAGLRENGWAIARNELGARAAEKAQQQEPAEPVVHERRLRSADAQP